MAASSPFVLLEQVNATLLDLHDRAKSSADKDLIRAVGTLLDLLRVCVHRTATPVEIDAERRRTIFRDADTGAHDSISPSGEGHALPPASHIYRRG